MQETIDVADMKGMAEEIVSDHFSDEGWVRTSTYVPSEMELLLYVNRQELVTILCTPTKLNFLALGFLYSEGIISGIGEVNILRVCEEESVADVRLSKTEFELPTQRRITSGCGGGASFKTQGQKVDSDLVATPTEVIALMKQLQEQMELYRL
ncbi:MAG: formate dehydrogenase accessory sulfurtransferase FdhD, partial [Desulfitobacteriaceae bacterium]